MLNPDALAALCRAALAEDVGSGDATTLAVVPESLETTAVISVRKPCVCAGLPVAEAVFRELDENVVFESLVRDGARLAFPADIARISGKARALITGERTALNFLQRLSGIATLTHRFVERAKPHGAEILDTRKTTPGLRRLEKYAVRMGGGRNHRMGLYDRVMIKDNHRALAALDGPGGIRRAVAACRLASRTDIRRGTEHKGVRCDLFRGGRESVVGKPCHSRLAGGLQCGRRASRCTTRLSGIAE